MRRVATRITWKCRRCGAEQAHYYWLYEVQYI
jgi:ribosomal protein L37AE/L43A